MCLVLGQTQQRGAKPAHQELTGSDRFFFFFQDLGRMARAAAVLVLLAAAAAAVVELPEQGDWAAPVPRSGLVMLHLRKPVIYLFLCVCFDFLLLCVRPWVLSFLCSCGLPPAVD